MKKRVIKIITTIILSIVIVTGLFGVAGYYILGKVFPCGTESIGTYISPDKEHEVNYYVVDCGATTYFVDNVELDGKTIFKGELRYPKGQALFVKWVNDDEILVEVAPTTESIKVFKLIDTYKDIQIIFDEKIMAGRRIN